MRPRASSPSDPPRSDTQPPTKHQAMQKARLAVHRRSACSGVKALRNTSDARRHAAKLCYRFGPLTPSARSANLIAGDGTKNGFSSSEQRTGKNQKRPLDRKSPIQVRIHLPPAESQLRTCFRLVSSSLRFPLAAKGGAGHYPGFPDAGTTPYVTPSWKVADAETGGIELSMTTTVYGAFG